MLEGLAWAELGRGEWLRAGSWPRRFVSRGHRPLTDIEIPVAALGADASVWSPDSDFVPIAEVAGDLELRAL